MLILKNHRMFLKIRKVFDYVPMLLLAFLFAAEHEMELHAIGTACQLVISIIVIIIFFVFALNVKNGKVIGLIVAVPIWAILIYLKKKYVPYTMTS